MSYKFTKSQRLLKTSEYKNVFNSSIKVVLPAFVIIAQQSKNIPAQDQDSQQPRFGVVVSKKVGNAVVRNKVKRLLRNAFRLNWREYANVLDGIDLVMIARPNAKQQSFAEVVKSFNKGIKFLLPKVQQMRNKLEFQTN